MPSSAFTLKGSGYLNPASISAVTSVCSNVNMQVPRTPLRSDAGARLYRAAVQADAVNMSVVGVLVCFAAASRKEERASFLIDPLYFTAHELARSKLSLQRTVRVEQIVMSPAVALRPVDHVAVAEQMQRLDFDIGIRP